jgi:hypothetical protein
MHHHLWGYKAEEKIYLGARERKRLKSLVQATLFFFIFPAQQSASALIISQLSTVRDADGSAVFLRTFITGNPQYHTPGDHTFRSRGAVQAPTFKKHAVNKPQKKAFAPK